MKDIHQHIYRRCYLPNTDIAILPIQPTAFVIHCYKS